MPEETPQEGQGVLGDFWVETVFGANTRKPFIRISLDSQPLIMLSPHDTFAFALNLIQCANASITDAFLFQFILETVEAGEPAAAGVLNEFRQWRSEQGFDLLAGNATMERHEE